MNVKELIEKLAAHPDDMRVVCHDGEYEDFFDIEATYVVPDAVNRTDERVLKLSPFEDGAEWDGVK